MLLALGWEAGLPTAAQLVSRILDRLEDVSVRLTSHTRRARRGRLCARRGESGPPGSESSDDDPRYMAHEADMHVHGGHAVRAAMRGAAI